jgi:hypothetical protein
LPAVAELLTQGSKPAELIESHPRLTCEIIRLAPVYAAVYPLRKTILRQLWHDHAAVHRGKESCIERLLLSVCYGEMSS